MTVLLSGLEGMSLHDAVPNGFSSSSLTQQRRVKLVLCGCHWGDTTTSSTTSQASLKQLTFRLGLCFCFLTVRYGEDQKYIPNHFSSLHKCLSDSNARPQQVMRSVPSAQNLVAYFIASVVSEKQEGFGALARICVRAVPALFLGQ